MMFVFSLNLNGKFQEKLTVAPGEYIITLSSVGKVTIVKEIGRAHV